MFNLFKKNKNINKEKYKVVFCSENNLDTKFHEYGIYETYETADHIIRMIWGKKRKDKINDGYQVDDDAWILIEKTT